MSLDKNLLKMLEGLDAKIEAHNTKMNSLYSKLIMAAQKTEALHTQLQNSGIDNEGLQAGIAIARGNEEKALAAYKRQDVVGKGLVGTGSGKVQALVAS
jgi:hypothetical protein